MSLPRPLTDMRIGIYEKALPDLADWSARMAAVVEAGYDFIEIPIDESEERLRRLDWSMAERAVVRNAAQDAGTAIQTLILSAHRRYPLGSAVPETREKATDILRRGIDLAVDLGARIIQLSGYYVFYEPHDDGVRERFRDGLEQGLEWASAAGVMLALENMDGEDITSVSEAMDFVEYFDSPWLQVYPDLGNLAGNRLDVCAELRRARGHLVGIHLKDARPGAYRRVAFGTGDVPFLDAFRTLADINYAGPFLVEMWNDDHPDAMRMIVDARTWLAASMAEAGLLNNSYGSVGDHATL